MLALQHVVLVSLTWQYVSNTSACIPVMLVNAMRTPAVMSSYPT